MLLALLACSSDLPAARATIDVVRAQEAELRACAAGEPAESVTLVWVLAAGKLQSVKLQPEGRPSSMRRCVVDVFRGMRFPAEAEGEFTVPMRL